jgi:putative transposase
MLGSCRWLWNHVLASLKAEYQEHLILKSQGVASEPPSITGYTLVNRLPAIKAVTPWLYDTPSPALQQVMLHLAQAYGTFFKTRKGYPRFKTRHGKQSMTVMTNCFQIRDGYLKVAKFTQPLVVGWGRCGKVRELPSIPTSATITKDTTGRYWVSFICEYTPAKTSGTKELGIDMGLKDLMVISDGRRIPNPKHLARYQRKMRRIQQDHARKQKGSKNRSKDRQRLARLHAKIANARNTFQHQLTRQLVNESKVIGVESLNTKGMVKNHHLAKSIHDASWTSIRQKLSYKARESQHCTIVQMDMWYPSTHICNHTKQRLDYRLKLSEREWPCPHCGQIHDRDLNAAQNTRDEALRTMTNFHPEPGVTVLATLH